MKKLACLLAASAFAMSLAATPTFADPGKGSAKTDVEFCKLVADAGITSSVGECMGIVRSDDAPQLCKAIDLSGLLDAFGFKNRGDCVSFLRTL